MRKPREKESVEDRDFEKDNVSSLNAPAIDDQQDPPDEEFNPDDIDVLNDSFDIKLRGWIDRVEYENKETQLYLYKFEGNTELKVFCGKWTNEIPEEHTVGLTFGSGKYVVIATIPELYKKNKKAGIKTIRFKIHSHYDTLRAQNPTGNFSGVGFNPAFVGMGSRGVVSENKSPQNVGNGNSITENAFAMLEKMMTLFMPLIAQKQASSPDPFGMFKMVGDVMKQSTRDNALFLRELTEKRLLPDNGDINNMPSYPEKEPEPAPEKEENIIEKLLPMVEKFLPLLMSQSPRAQLASQGVIAMAKAAPQFQKVVKDRTELNKLIAFLDSKYTSKKVDVMLKKLGVTRG